MFLEEGFIHTGAETEAFSLAGLIAWLEKQAADGEYDYTDPDNCLLCQYFSARGIQHDGVTYNRLHHAGGGFTRFPTAFKSIAQGMPYEANRWTFGAALDRARFVAHG